MFNSKTTTSAVIFTTAACTAVIATLLFVHPFAEFMAKEGEIIAELRLTRAEASLAVVHHFTDKR
ncbi:hypothetical protein E0H59_36615 [Rhizobium leguminosarum bv. viciae]|nr:hypothetical protein E0H59_36615 [Rhizobium leguminosarum bv. viciae]